MVHKRKLPKSINDLIDFGWLDFMRAKIKRFNLRDINNHPDDIIQDMLLLMCRNGFIEKYDEDGRPFEVYLSVFITNFMSKRYKKEVLSQNGQSIINASCLEISAPQEYTSMDTSNILYLDHINLEETSEQDSIILIESLREELSKYKATSSVMYNGIEYQRDPLTVFNLLLKGYTPADIAEIFQTSRQFVYLLIKRIREAEALMDYHSK